jgi:4-cresol dehydrogenase (hydroxylating)
MTEARVLPARVTAAQFSRVLTEFRAAVGIDNVLDRPEELAPYGRHLMPLEDDEHRPSAVVAPASVAEIQQVLAICNRSQVPVWTVSTGRNFGYGSSAPATRGQVVLDLHRLNRILAVDAELGTALVEPGVTYQKLQDYLKERDIPLWLDFPAPGPLVGPVGNTLERGGGMTPYGDHFANSCGMEVLLADGTLVRTGMGELQGGGSWQCYRYGYGPFLDGLFTQSNFGIVTKLGLWLMPAPPAHRTAIAMWANDADLSRAIDAIRPLRLDGTIPNFGTFANATLVITSMLKRSEVYGGAGAVPVEVANRAAAAKGIGAWLYVFTLYGTPERIAMDSRTVQQALERSGAKVIFDVNDPMHSNELSLQTFSLFNWAGGGGLCWFSPVSPARGADVAKQTALARSIMDAHGVDFMAGMSIVGREILNVMPLVFDRGDAATRQRVRACFNELLTRFAAEGYGIYRTGIGFMDRAAELNGPVKRALANRIKRVLDPNGILAPGKSGIGSRS